MLTRREFARAAAGALAAAAAGTSVPAREMALAEYTQLVVIARF
jgi:hypothetical protein